MDQTHLIDGLFVVLFGVGGWWVKNIWTMVLMLQVQMVRLEVDLGKNYTDRKELNDTFDRIFDALVDIRKELKKP